MTHDRRDRSRWIKQMQAKLRRDRAMPRNLSAEHRLQIKMIYADARRLGMTVDHIVPINHSLVCGLHVPWNMRLMKGGANSAKGNRFDLSSAEVLAPRTGVL